MTLRLENAIVGVEAVDAGEDACEMLRDRGGPGAEGLCQETGAEVEQIHALHATGCLVISVWADYRCDFGALMWRLHIEGPKSHR